MEKAASVGGFAYSSVEISLMVSLSSITIGSNAFHPVALGDIFLIMDSL